MTAERDELRERIAEMVRWAVTTRTTHTVTVVDAATDRILALLAPQEAPSGPYTIQVIPDASVRSGEHYRITDADDNRVATCYLRENAETVCRALNAARPAPDPIPENSDSWADFLEEYGNAGGGHIAGTAMIAIAGELRRLARPAPEPAGPGTTHYEGCWRERGHHECAIAEIERRPAPETREPVTPLPWSYQENSDAYTHIVRGPSGEIVCAAPQDSTGRAEADMRFIVEAVNRLGAPAPAEATEAHRELLNAALAVCDKWRVFEDEGLPEGEMGAAIDRLYDAMGAAEGGGS